MPSLDKLVFSISLRGINPPVTGLASRLSVGPDLHQLQAFVTTEYNKPDSRRSHLCQLGGAYQQGLR